MKWSEADEIGYQLCEKFPETDPFTVHFTDLHSMVAQLDDFDDAPAASTEATLEAIQMAWLEYFQEQ